jgi:hypothetical protein
MSGQYQDRKENFKQYTEKNNVLILKKKIIKKDYNITDMIPMEENKNTIKEYAKQWKQDNPSMVWAQKPEYFENNKDKINECRRRKYAENKEQIQGKKREYRKAQKAHNISV